MKASIVDLRYKMNDVLKALDRNESVTILYRGKEKGIFVPSKRAGGLKSSEHPAFGIWRKRTDMKDVQTHVRELRSGRYRDL